jgi:cupin 2 domain-containing protein
MSDEGESGPTSLFDAIPFDLPRELIEVLAESPSLRIERIVSLGHTFENEPSVMLMPGDFLAIPARRRHRVDWTDPDRPTVWLAIFAQSWE